MGGWFADVSESIPGQCSQLLARGRAALMVGGLFLHRPDDKYADLSHDIDPLDTLPAHVEPALPTQLASTTAAAEAKP